MDFYTFCVQVSNPFETEIKAPCRQLGSVRVGACEIFNEDGEVDIAAWHGFLALLSSRLGNPCAGFRYTSNDERNMICANEHDFDVFLEDMEGSITGEGVGERKEKYIEVLPLYRFEIYDSKCNEYFGEITTDATQNSWENFLLRLREIAGRNVCAFSYQCQPGTSSIDASALTSCLQPLTVDSTATFCRCLARIHLAAEHQYTLRIFPTTSPSRLDSTIPRYPVIQQQFNITQTPSRASAAHGLPIQLSVLVSPRLGQSPINNNPSKNYESQLPPPPPQAVLVALRVSDPWTLVRCRLAELSAVGRLPSTDAAAGEGDSGATAPAFVYLAPEARGGDVRRVEDEESWLACVQLLATEPSLARRLAVCMVPPRAAPKIGGGRNDGAKCASEGGAGGDGEVDQGGRVGSATEDGEAGFELLCFEGDRRPVCIFLAARGPGAGWAALGPRLAAVFGFPAALALIPAPDQVLPVRSEVELAEALVALAARRRAGLLAAGPLPCAVLHLEDPTGPVVRQAGAADRRQSCIGLGLGI